MIEFFIGLFLSIMSAVGAVHFAFEAVEAHERNEETLEEKELVWPWVAVSIALSVASVLFIGVAVS